MSGTAEFSGASHDNPVAGLSTVEAVTPPLEGVRVLDLTWGMPGAVATMMLADYGAEVIHVDRPGGDPASRSGATRPWDRGKRRLTLDLDAPTDHECFMELARHADVVLVGLAAPSVARLGLDPDEIAAVNPDVVYVALSGFGRHDRRATRGLDALVAAELGAMVAVTPHHRDGPVFLAHPAVAYSTALVAVTGVLAALRARILAGRGDVVDVSLLDGVLAQLTMNWWTDRDISFLASRRLDGQLDLGRTRMIVRRYTCRDGKMIQVHTGAAGAFGRLMKVLGLDSRISPVTGPIESASPLTDADIEIVERLPEVFATRTAQEWLDEIWRNEIAALPENEPAVVFDDDQVLYNGLIRRVEDPELGCIEVVAAPIKLSRTPAVDTGPYDPADDVRATGWLGAGLPEGGDAVLTRGPLDGVTVVELATFFASPYANRFLRDLGADVIKVEPTSGDPMRSLPDPFEGASRGKRGIALDLKSTDARPVIEELLRRADVVQHNFRPGVAERLHVDYAAARELNPDVVYSYAPGYGSSGPKSSLQSFAPLHSGFVGIHSEASGEGNPPMQTFGNEDYYNGQLNAVAILLGLLHKARTGQGQYVECSQLNSSVLATSHWYRVDGQRRSVLPRLDHDQFGWSPYHRIYQCLEGYVCVYCTDPSHETAVRSVVLGPDRSSGPEAGDDLVYEFYGRPAGDWVQMLRDAGVPCGEVLERSWLLDFLVTDSSIAAGRATRFDHPQYGPVSAIGRIVQLEGYEALEPVRAPLLGEHSRQVLAEVGVNDDEAVRLVAAGVVRSLD
jgi:crotonobetainyl-CoA:carnitine CoA-transferase CaiB-like acyl-CoA transferase